MESQPQNPEFRINPENFHPCYQQMTKVATSKVRVKVPPKAGSRQHFQILKNCSFKQSNDACYFMRITIQTLFGQAILAAKMEKDI